jgi:hypothetical protein
VRKWLVGRGIKRTGLPALESVTSTQPGEGEPPPAATLQFVPVEFAPTAGVASAEAGDDGVSSVSSDIHIELTRGGTRLSVRWPRTRRRGAQGMIVDAWWLCTQPQDMRAGADRLLAVVVNTIGEARPRLPLRQRTR